MTTYTIEFQDGVLKIGFADPAQNNRIVVDAATRLDELVIWRVGRRSTA